MANYIYGAIALTGGGTGALDSIDGTDLQDLDSALVFTGTTFYAYSLDADSGAAEDSPNVIIPDTNSGNKRWVLITSRAADSTLDTSSFAGLLSASEDDVQKALDVIDDMFNSDDFSVSSGVASLDDDVVKSVATDSGTITPSSHQFTIEGSGKINTEAVDTTAIISIDDLSISTKAGAYPMTAADDVIIGDTAGGGFDITLPAANSKALVRIIKKSNSNTLTVQRNGTDLIDGQTSIALLTEGEILTLVSDDSSNWYTQSVVIDTTAFGGILSANQDTLQKVLDTIDDMFDGTDFTVSEGSVAINEAGVDHDTLNNTHNLTTDIDHGSISGRGDDDHAQYSLADGTRAFTGVVGGIAPTDDAHLATKGYVDGIYTNLDWQESILDRTNEAGATATTGNRYISTETSGTWTINNIYEYNGSSWDETTVSEGMTCWVQDEDVNYTYNGSAWVKFGNTVTHNNLANLNVGDYVHLTATEKTKFDGIEDNATADQTASEILTALLTVDGTGTGLDADLLDGVEGASYVRKDAYSLVSNTTRWGDDRPIQLGDDADFSLVHSSGDSISRIRSSVTDGKVYFQATHTGTGTVTHIEFDPVSDVTKLWNPQTQNGNTIWHDGNDGAGSGLDADLLDGQSSNFYRNAGNLDAGLLPAARFDDTAHGSRSGGTLHPAATGSVAGFMSASDKSKLDGFASAGSYVRNDTAGNISAHLEFQDSYQCRFGNDADMQLFHTGSGGYLDIDTGIFYIRNAAEQVMIHASQNDSALYYQGGIRLITTSAGIQIGNGSNWSGDIQYAQSSPSGSTVLGYNGYFYATRVYGAVYNDIADFQDLSDDLEYGRCYFDTKDGAKICTSRCQLGVIGIASDTYGFSVGEDNREGAPDKAPFAIGGWTLAYVDKEYPTGTPLTNDYDGSLTEMTLDEKRDFPERIVATYKKPEPNENWGPEDNPVKVNGRHWVKVK